MSDTASLREHVIQNLDGGNAHRGFAAILQGWPSDVRGERPTGLPYTGWELLEHLRIGQRDILDFWRHADYTPLNWPDDYWPDAQSPPSDEAWRDSVQHVQDDLSTFKTLIREADDLYAEIPHGDGQTYLREALLAADHNAYHLGQLVTVRRLLDVWPPKG